jgi:hypothetical protein
MALGTHVIVPIVNPDSAVPLLRLAARVAHADAGRITAVTVLPLRTTQRMREEAAATIATVRATPVHGVPVDGVVIESARPSDGVLEAVDTLGGSLVVMGWAGRSTTSDVFGQLIDSVVGRSRVPLLVVRAGGVPATRALLPVSADHLQPGGERGLDLAATVTARLRADLDVALLRTGPRDVPLPARLAALGDRVHHDPRRTDQAVAAIARPSDLVVAAVAPTASGLRNATTHLAWAAPDATLVVALDVGPTATDEEAETDGDLPAAVAHAGDAAPTTIELPERIAIDVTVRVEDDGRAASGALLRVLQDLGEVRDHLIWWPEGEPTHLRATLELAAAGANRAVGEVMQAVHDDAAFHGAEITYEVTRLPASAPAAVSRD